MQHKVRDYTIKAVLEKTDRHELVEQLYTTAVPNLVMTASFGLVGAFASVGLRDRFSLLVLSIGTLAGLMKLGLIVRNRPSARRISSYPEMPFAVLSVVFAAALAAFCARMFAVGGANEQMLATGLLFGYCAGVVTRASVRPAIASACVTVAALPVAAAAGWHGDRGHALLSGLFLVFLVGSFETIRSTYKNAVLHIGARKAIDELANTDALTGLLNRRGLAAAQGRMRIGGVDEIAVHVIDLDGFKAVNDVYGHAAGDELLRIVARRIRQNCRFEDAVARIGGDEFLVMHDTADPGASSDGLADRVRADLCRPCRISGVEIFSSASVGTARGFLSGDLQLLIEQADGELYRSKHQRRRL